MGKQQGADEDEREGGGQHRLGGPRHGELRGRGSRGRSRRGAVDRRARAQVEEGVEDDHGRERCGEGEGKKK